MMKPKNNCTCTDKVGCANCAEWTAWTEMIEALSRSFCKHIRSHVSEETIARAVAEDLGLNEYFDADYSMSLACEELGCLEILAADENSPDKVENNCIIMNTAWEWAMKRNYAL